MFKPNNKKMLTVLITLAMVFSALAVMSFAAQPAYAASGTVTYNPTVFTAGVPTQTYASGGAFGSGSTVYFYFSTTDSSTGIVGGSIGSVTLSAGVTTLNNVVTLTMPSGHSSGYILAEDFISGSPSGTYAGSGPVTITTLTPAISLYPTGPYKVGQTVYVSTTSPFDPSSTVEVFLNSPGNSTVLISSITTKTGSIPAKTYSFTVPALAQGSYYAVAQEISGTPNGGATGVTADASFSVVPSITVSPMSITGATTSSFTISGTGFAAKSVIKSSSVAPGTVTVASINAIEAGTTVASDGSFTLTVTGLSSAITAMGPATITVTTTPASSVSSFSDAIYVSTPNLISSLGFSFADVGTGAPLSSGYFGDPIVAAVWDFPASTTVTIMMGTFSIGNITTDANGFGELPATATLPALPYGTYAVVAEAPSHGLFVTPTITPYSPFTVYSEYFALDPSGGSVVNEYVPYNGLITVYAYGLNPSDAYTFDDSVDALSTVYDYGNVFADGLVTSVSVGTENIQGTAIYPAANGTVIFTYSPAYAASYEGAYQEDLAGLSGTITIHPSADVSIGTGSSPVSGNIVGTYNVIVAPQFTTPSIGAIYAPGNSITVSLSYLIPYTASAVYPTENVYYSLYLNNQLLTLTVVYPSGSVSSTMFTTAATSVSFTVPSGINGFDTLSAVYVGMTPSSALGKQYIVVSSAETSNTGAALGALYDNATQTLYMWGYDFSSSQTSLTLYYMTYSGLINFGTVSLSDGGFFASAPVTEPYGTYSVFTSVTSVTPTTYTVTPYFTSLSGGYMPVGSSFKVSVFSLQPNTYYYVSFGTSVIDEEISLSNGTFIYSEAVPLVPKGTYTLGIEPVSSPSTIVASQPFTVIVNSELSLSTMSQYAFPDQIVQFSVGGLSLPTLQGPNGPSGIMLPTGYEANVYFNGTLLATVPATFQLVSGSYYLNGSFKMPNNAAGSYYLLTISGIVEYQNTLGSSILSSSVLSTGSLPMVGSQSDFLGLAEGNGALITGITPSEIATIEFDINSTVTKSLSVPIAQLDAAITSINGAVANLKTTVGNITVALSTINATVLSVSKGVALLQTDLGQVQTSLASLNATLVSIKGNTAMIETTVGMVNTTVSSINMTVSSTATSVSGLVGSVATVQTSLGTISGTVTSISGSVATIQTSLGTLQTSVNAISLNTSKVSSLSSTLSTSEIFEIVILVLVLITLVLSFLAISSVNKVAKKVEEQKKQ